MKRFNVNSIALQNLRGRKKSYVLLAMAIVLAIYFVSTVLLLASMLATSYDSMHLKRYGAQDVVIHNCKAAPLGDLISGGTLNEYGTASILGYAVLNNQSLSGGFSVATFDSTALRLAGKAVLQGRLPQKAGEIAIERSVLPRLQSGGLGSQLKLTLRVPDGKEFLKNTVQKTYTLVGILADQLVYQNQWNELTPAYDDAPAAVVFSGEQVEAGGKAVVNCYGVYAGNAKADYKQIEAFCKANGLLDGYGTASSENTYYAGVFSSDFEMSSPGDYNEKYNMLIYTVVMMIIAAILVFAACLGIVNAFTTNLEQRRRQIGLLRAVGATKKQIREIFGREALLLACCSVPAGVLLACLTVWGTAKLLGEQYTFSPSPPVLLLVAAAGILCVMLAAAIPLKKASTIPPMQAIRDVALSRRMKKRSVKTRRLFDAPWLLARRGFILYPNRQLGVTALLAVTIVLIGLLTGLAGPQLYRISQYTYGVDFTMGKTGQQYRIVMAEDFHAPGITEQDRLDAASLPGVAQVRGYKLLRVKLLVDKVTSYLTADGYSDMDENNFLMRKMPADAPNAAFFGGSWAAENDQYLACRKKYGYQKDYLTVCCAGVDQETVSLLSGCVTDGAIHPDKLASGEEVLVVAPKEYGIRVTDVDSNGYKQTETDYAIDPSKKYLFTAKNDTFRAGGKLTLSLLYTDGKIENDADSSSLALPDNAVRLDKTVTIGAVLDPDKMHEVFNTGALRYSSPWLDGFHDVLTTNEGLSALGFGVPYNELSVTLSASPTAAQEGYLTNSLKAIAGKTPNVELRSYVAMARDNRNTLVQVLVVCGAVILLFFSLSASMVNNALSARIRAGKREIGTLRAVGASHREIARSYLWQLLWMFLWGTVIGIAAELAISAYLILSAAPGSVYSIALWQPLAYVAALFLLCFANVHSKVKAITRGSIVENIREL